MKLLVSTLVAAAALSLAPPAAADPVPGHPDCVIDLWGFLGSQRRTICDGPIRADGSWIRGRVVSVPAHYVPQTYTSNCFGSGYVTCSGSSYGGYFQPYVEISEDSYPVNNDDIVPGEPGHLG
jgi:hypothetical protein